MTRQWIAGLVISGLLGQSVAAQTTVTEPSNPNLGLGGVLVMLGSLGMIVPITSGEKYEILGKTYCLENEHTLTRGDCGGTTTPTLRKIGIVTLGAGALMTYLGYRSKTVTIAPQVSQTGARVTATVKW
jgi:hypothetical protein